VCVWPLQGLFGYNAQSPLHHVAERGHDSLVAILLAYKADVNSCLDGVSAGLGFLCGDTFTSFHFLNSKKSWAPSTCSDTYDVHCVLSQCGSTPLDRANEKGHPEVARQLKAAGGIAIAGLPSDDDDGDLDCIPTPVVYNAQTEGVVVRGRTMESAKDK
jgi:ankyrin repeat protein